MKTLHTILTVLFGIDIIYATYQFLNTMTYAGNAGLNIIAIFIGSYLFAAILFIARYFVGKNIKE